jgi:hypothetical protein
MPESLLREGMGVIGSDGQPVGRVRLVGSTDFAGLWIARPGGGDVWVGPTLIREVVGDEVILSVPADQVDQVSTSHAPMAEVESEID